MKNLFSLFFSLLIVSGAWVACSTDEESYTIIGHEHPTGGQDVYPKEQSYKGRPYVVFGFGGDHLTVEFCDLEFKGRPEGVKTIKRISKTAEGHDSLTVVFEPVYRNISDVSIEDDSYYLIWFELGGDSISHGDKMYLKCNNNGYSYDGLVSLIDNDRKGFVEIEMNKDESISDMTQQPRMRSDFEKQNTGPPAHFRSI
ncbi:MAG: hypothetical protein IKQ59_14175 [Prevotella sp.]|nr:hypothetical protein [Prevotella sp.]